MRIFHILLLTFLLVPLLEIYILIQVGGTIGALPTVFFVVFTAVLGAFLLRHQGFATLQRARVNMARGEVPAVPMLEGVVLLIGGLLLLTPGFFTDALGFLCLLPPLRRGAIGWLLRRGVMRVVGAPGRHPAPRSRVIEGECRREDDERH